MNKILNYCTNIGRFFLLDTVQFDVEENEEKHPVSFIHW